MVSRSAPRHERSSSLIFVDLNGAAVPPPGQFPKEFTNFGFLFYGKVLDLRGNDDLEMAPAAVLGTIEIAAFKSSLVQNFNAAKKAGGNSKPNIKTAGWDEVAIKKLSPDDITAITAGDVAHCSPRQLWGLLKYHGGSESQLPAGIFDGVSEIRGLKGMDLSGKDLS